jgi:hypothetical protein
VFVCGQVTQCVELVIKIVFNAFGGQARVNGLSVIQFLYGMLFDFCVDGENESPADNQADTQENELFFVGHHVGAFLQVPVKSNGPVFTFRQYKENNRLSQPVIVCRLRSAGGVSSCVCGCDKKPYP